MIHFYLMYRMVRILDKKGRELGTNNPSSTNTPRAYRDVLINEFMTIKRLGGKYTYETAVSTLNSAIANEYILVSKEISHYGPLPENLREVELNPSKGKLFASPLGLVQEILSSYSILIGFITGSVFIWPITMLVQWIIGLFKN